MFVKDLRLALTQMPLTLMGVLMPVNLLFLLILLALSGGPAPTAVVFEDPGPLAHQFIAAMQHSNSFHLTEMTPAQASSELQQGRIVAVVTIPASFDDDLRSGRPVQLPVQINNLNSDFANDIRRAVRESIISFYADALPGQIVVSTQEIDLHPHDTGYIAYLAVSIVTTCVFVQAMLQATLLAAREYEGGTYTQLLLAPVSRSGLILGKVAAAFVLTAAAAIVVTAVVVFGVGVRPVHPVELAGVILLVTVPFVALGILAGTVVKRVQAAIPLSLGVSLPLFFISGPFGPPSGQGLGAVLALLSPLTYAIALFQHAFHGYQTTRTDTSADVVVLGLFSLLAVVATAVIVRRDHLA